MKIIVWVLAILLFIGGLFYFISSSDTSDSSESNKIDALSENGRVLDTDIAVFEELDDAINIIE